MSRLVNGCPSFSASVKSPSLCWDNRQPPKDRIKNNKNQKTLFPTAPACFKLLEESSGQDEIKKGQPIRLALKTFAGIPYISLTAVQERRKPEAEDDQTQELFCLRKKGTAKA
jgi:hypothetical protein